MDQKKIHWNLENTYRRLPKRLYSKAIASIFPKPELVIFNDALAEELGIDKAMAELSEEQKAALFSGNVFPEGAEPISQAYGGHQFGYFSVLGDGRAILLGEWLDARGERFDIQLKGSGVTPYSRSGDGKAVIGPMLREYLISEAVHGLGIPTTRSLAVVLTGETVYRDGLLPGAVLTRVASSHLRVGTFQFAFSGGKEELQELMDYAIARHYPEVMAEKAGDDRKTAQRFLGAVVERQAELIARWQLVGFIHGVMNTDNMTISGETIDYGPCAFMDEFNPATVFSSIDRQGRYRFENQPAIGQWNLSRLADALLPLLDDRQELAVAWATEELVNYAPKYQRVWLSGMKSKLGMFGENPADKQIINELLHLMEKRKADYTNTFVRLTLETEGKDGSYLQGTEELFGDEGFQEWQTVWQARRQLPEKSKQEIVERMKGANPFVIPRNFRVEEVLTGASKGDYSGFREFLQVLQNPYDYTVANIKYQELSSLPTAGYKTYCGT